MVERATADQTERKISGFRTKNTSQISRAVRYWSCTDSLAASSARNARRLMPARSSHSVAVGIGRLREDPLETFV